MLNKSALTLFVTIVFAGFTAAYPEPHRRSVTPFATVSLGKRNALTRDDGTFNAEEAMRSAAKTKNKHEQNLRNLQHNVLSMALLEEVRSIYITHTLILIDIFLRMQSPPSPMVHIQRRVQNR